MPKIKYAKYQCNKCKGVYFRALGYKVWTSSYCEKTGMNARLYRITEPVYSENYVKNQLNKNKEE